MALDVGTCLGAYEITGTLGAGGMGEVYRATDTNLRREVAIKILPPAFASDADRIARFQREAEALAALNHPNIAQIYGLERSGETTALVMELVEGPTLADRIAEGPVPSDEALAIAMQIADALEAAQEQNIVHRDLKPANVKLKADGTVKVLDFGIATAPESAVVTSGQRSPTLLTPALTEVGVLLGTAAYMSPEQARGKAVDRRADIWAFGCVLYEMLTGQPAFGGEDVTTTLARVLEREANTTALPATLPSAVRHTIALCLEKDVKKRIADIRDVKLALEGTFESTPQSAAEKETVVRPLWRRVLPVAAALVVGAVGTGLPAWFLARPNIPKLARFDVTPDGGLSVMGSSPSAAVSGDGQSIAYLAGGNGTTGAKELRLRRLNQLGSVLLVAGTGIGSPFFSPDGTQIGFYTGRGGSILLERVSVQGGPTSTITKLPANLRGASWGADGTIIYGTEDTASGLWRVRAAGGTPEMLTKPEPKNGVVNHWWPEILPGGKAVLFTMIGRSEQDSKIAVLSLATGKQRVLVRGGVSPHYSPTGHLLFGRAGTLFAVRFDAARLQVEGDPVPVQQGVLTKGNVGATEVSLASNGTLLYLSRPQTAVPQRHLVWVDDEGHETPVPLPPRAYDQVVLSPDGTHAALGIEGNKSVWIADLNRGTLERLPADLGDQDPSILFFSTDGQRVASSAARDGRQAIVWQAVDGTGAAKPLVTFDGSVTGVGSAPLSPDGKRFVPTVQRQNADLGIVTVGDLKSYHDFLATPANEGCPAISPHGHWIAYCSDDTGTFQVYVQRFPEGGGRLAVSIKGGAYPHWSADGSVLTYVQSDGATAVGMMRVPVTGLEVPKGSPTFGTPKELFPYKYFFVGDGLSHFDMTADEKRFLMITASPKNDKATRLVLVRNWLQDLKRIVPTN